MIAGKMRDRVGFLEPVVTTDAYGDEVTTWTDRGRFWAERVKYTGTRSDEVGEHFPAYRAEWLVRIGVPVAANWRLYEFSADPQNNEVWNVLAVVRDAAHGLLRLSCERLNP